MTNALPKSILLDLDDTIIATNVVADGVWQSVCSEFAPRLQGLSSQQLFTGVSGAPSLVLERPCKTPQGALEPF